MMIDEKKVKENLKKTITQQEQVMIYITAIQTALVYKGIVTEEEMDKFEEIASDVFF